MKIINKNVSHLLILAMSILSQLLNAQDATWCKSLGWETYVKTAIEQENLNGPVSSVLIQRFFAKEKYGEIIIDRSAAKNLPDSKICFDSLGYLINKITYDTMGVTYLAESFTYNEQHQLFLHLQKYANKTRLETKFTYNEAGDKITESFYRQGAEMTRYIFEYNEKGHISKESKYGKDGDLTERTIFKCDENFKTKVGTLKDKNGKVWQENKFTYDMNGNLIEELVTNPDYTQKTVYKYDNSGNQIYYEINNPDWYSAYAMEYNIHNDVIKVLEYSRSGVLIKTIVYEYEYDKKNNWIKCIQFENDIAKEITTRKIEYFN